MGKQISSGLKTLFLIHFIVGILFGAVLFLIPLVYGSIINWTVKDPGAFRLIGAAMLGISCTSLLAYKNPDWDKVRITVILEIIWTVLGTLAMVWAILFEGFPPITWMNAGIFIVFAVFFLVFYAREKE
jgi:drug/metabolite transporter (DMT)-like permease